MKVPKGMEAVVFSSAYYKVHDFEKVHDFLIRLSEKGLFGSEKENPKTKTLKGCFIRDYPKGHWNPLAGTPGAKQVVGNVKIKNGILKIQANTKSGLKSIREILNQGLGKIIEFQREEFKDPREMLK